MAQLKGTEKFVAESLQSYFSKTSNSVNFEEGDDPPDIYLKIDDKKIAVEITGCGTYFITYLCSNFLSTLNIYKKHIINLKIYLKSISISNIFILKSTKIPYLRCL